MKTIILAGGKGTRLQPITHEIPKPLIPVKKKPLLNHILNFLNKYGIGDISFIISEDHKEDFKKWENTWDAEIHIKPKFFIESKPAGTFACLRLIKDYANNDDLLVINGDSLIDFNLPELIAAHKSGKQIVTACILQTNTTGHYIVPEINDGSIKKLERKVVEPLTEFICSGVYILRPEVFKYDDPMKELLNMEDDIFPKLIVDNKIIGTKISPSRFFDCVTLESWTSAIHLW